MNNYSKLKSELDVKNKIDKSSEENFNNVAEENFMFHILNNSETVLNLSKYYSIMQLCCITSILVFLIMCFVASFCNFSYFIPISLLMLSWIFFIIQCNLMLRIKSIIDEYSIEKNNLNNSSSKEANISNKIKSEDQTLLLNEEDKTKLNSNSSKNYECKTSFSYIFTMIYLNFLFISVLTFFVLLAVKLDNFNALKTYQIILSLIIGCGLSLIYLLYLLPGLMKKELYYETILFFICVFTVITSLILINTKLSAKENHQKEKLSWLVSGIPIIIFIITYLLFKISSYNKNEKLSYFSSIFGIIFLLKSVILILLKSDGSIALHNSFIALGFIIAYILSFLNYFYGFVIE